MQCVMVLVGGGGWGRGGEINIFDILNFNPIISDVHCAITLGIKHNNQITDENININALKTTKIHWEPTKKQEFVDNLDINVIRQIEQNLNSNETTINNENTITKVVDMINNVFNKAKEKTFRKTTSKPFIKKKPWYDRELNNAKKRFKNARNSKNKQRINNEGKNYKSILRNKKANYTRNLANKLRNLKSKDSANYWKLLKGAHKKECNNISLDQFELFFKNLNKNMENTDFEENLNNNINNNTNNVNNNNNTNNVNNNTNTNNNEIYNLLNEPINEEEIETAVKNLKNNKSPGDDGILNEQIKSTYHLMKNIYLKLFNIILLAGCFPDIWALGSIVPIFKKKGNINDPNNYRGITLISCLGKLFDSVLNNRLKKASVKLLLENQAGFKPDYATQDHAFTLYLIFVLYRRLNKPLYMAFIDYKKAFDTIWRAGLWLKLIKQGINGNFLKIIQNMYEKSKAYVLLNNKKSNKFAAEVGVKQGEILSPLLFAFYISDLETHFLTEGVQPLSGIKSINDEIKNLDGIDYLLDILTLFYADDTIILSDSALGLQFALEELESYCEKWKLIVNEDKTKIMCITHDRQPVPTFYYNHKELEVVNEFIYLGYNFSKNGMAAPAIKDRKIKAEKAMYSTLLKCKQNLLPIDVSLDMFQKMVLPCMLYGAELWGFNNFLDLERVQLKYLKYSLNLKKNTPTVMVYGETGILPIEFHIKFRMVNFWISLITGKQNKLSYRIFMLCISLYKKNLLECKWLSYIKQIVDDCGMSFVFDEQLTLEKDWLLKAFLPEIKYNLKDQLIQKWSNNVNLESEKCFYYKEFDMNYKLQNYLSILPRDLWMPLCKFRTSNHKFPVEFYSWDKFFRERKDRTCTICNLNDIGDEYHYVMICPVLKEIREIYIPNFYINRPSVYKFTLLMNSEKKKTLFNLAKFLKETLEIFQ